MKRWVKYGFLHSDLIGWINLSYHPFWRNDLRPIAQQILNDYDGLEQWAEDLLKELEFIENNETWECHFSFWVA